MSDFARNGEEMDERCCEFGVDYGLSSKIILAVHLRFIIPVLFYIFYSNHNLKALISGLLSIKFSGVKLGIFFSD